MSKETARKPGRALTPRELAFCYSYIANKFNGKAAALEAGYSEKTATEQACDLLTRPHIRDKVAELMAQHLEDIGIKSSDVIRELSLIAFSDLRKFVTWGEKGVTLKSSEDIGEYSVAIQNLQIDDITLDGVAIGKTYKIRMHDKKGALELIGKHLKLFADRLHVYPRNPTDPNPEEVQEIEPDLSALSTEELRQYNELTQKLVRCNAPKTNDTASTTKN